jgi:DNA-binding transcriptional LysR family regulator
MTKDLFDGVPQFLAVARLSGFRAAARELGVTPGAISQAIRGLEARLGVPLFVRTTRRVALTEAGVAFASQLSVVERTVAEAIAQASASQDRPTGILRLCVRRMAIPLLADILPVYRAACPGVAIEVEIRDGGIDLIREGFDAGIRIGEFIEPDMIAVPIGARFHWIIVASPDYLAARGRPKAPADILGHDCIRFRFPGSVAPYRWELRANGSDLRIDPPGDLIVTDSALLCELAERGLGLAYTSDVAAQNALEDRRLKTVLADYMPPADSLYLYFPTRSQSQPKLRALLDIVAEFGRRRR